VLSKEDESVEDVVENVNEKSGSQKDALESENPAEEEGTYVKSAETVLTDNETEKPGRFAEFIYYSCGRNNRSVVR